MLWPPANPDLIIDDKELAVVQPGVGKSLEEHRGTDDREAVHMDVHGVSDSAAVYFSPGKALAGRTRGTGS